MKLFHHRTPGDLIMKTIKAEADAEAGYAEAWEAGADLETRGRYTDLSNRALRARRTLEYPGRVEADDTDDTNVWVGL